MENYVIRDKRAVVSLTEREKKQLESMIALSGLSSQEFMRKVLLSGIDGEHKIMVVEQSDEIKKLLKELNQTLDQQKHYMRQQNIELINLTYALTSNTEVIGSVLRDIYKEYAESRQITNKVRRTAYKIIMNAKQNTKYYQPRILIAKLLKRQKGSKDEDIEFV